MNRMSVDLWPDFLEDDVEINNSIEILREQARLLEKKTDRKVRATFSLVQYAPTDDSNSVPAAIVPRKPTKETEILEPTLSTKRDANTLYSSAKYKFEIYNFAYRFRVFTLDNTTFFPAYVNLDEGIANELRKGTFNVIESNQDLIDLITLVFKSRKLRNIIGKMLHDWQEKKNN